MNGFARFRAMRLERRKSFRVLLIIELLALIIGVVGLFGKDAEYVYDAVDKYVDAAESVVDFTGMTLPKGTYRVQLYYDTDTDGISSCVVEDAGLGEGLLRTNGANLYSGRNHTDFEMWLLRDSRELTVKVNYSGVGTLKLQSLMIRETNAWNRIILFLLLCTCTIVNMVYCYIEYDRKYGISVKNKGVAFGLGLIILIAALPLARDYIVGSGDLVYHLMRVEGIKDGILNGQFPVRISPEWQQGYGYASPIFYGETILYLAAIFRLIGFSVTTSYRLFMFLVTTATVLIAFFSFKKIFRDSYTGLLCSMLYTFSIYRIHISYIPSRLGECLGIMLLPLIFYGFWRIYTQDVMEESYQRSWVALSVGFTLLFQSHLLTSEIAGLFAVLLCIILWKKTFHPRTFLVLVKAVLISILLSAWFLIPFSDYMLTGDFVIHHVSGRTIQERGLDLKNLLFASFLDGGNVLFSADDIADGEAVGVGIASVVPLVIFVGLFITGKINELTKQEKTLGVIAGIFSVLSVFMNLNSFPWNRIQSFNSVTARLVSSIQFPNRFMTIVNVALVAVAGVVTKNILAQKKLWITFCYTAGMVLLLALSAIYLQDGVLDRMKSIRIYNSEGMGTGYIAGAEYLPYGADAGQFMYHDPICTRELLVTDYKKLSLGAKAHMTNLGDNLENAAFSLLYYKGYHAWGDDGQELNCYAGVNYEVTVDIPVGYDGEVTIEFVSPWYWRAGELVTLATILAGMGFLVYYAKRRFCLNKGNEGNAAGEKERT